VWEGGVREPFIASLPGVIPAGSSIQVPAMTIDLLPTVAALTGSDMPSRTVDGVNILPLLRGDSIYSPHDALFFYYNVNELQAVQSGQWKLYFPHSYRTLNGGYAGKDGLPGEYRQVRMEQAELYNLNEDPSETTNVAGNYPEIVAKLVEMANQIREELGDSLRGPARGHSGREPWTRQN
jgi:arylsulfatase